MRPLRLRLEGFTSFREPTVVDFTSADYFVLVGPTGSGKSSLIDAIAFALYGCISRYDDRRLVAPVISEGRLEAKVGLDFALGTQHFRAVRVVRHTGRGKGASTKEARLERTDPATGDVLEVLAGDADGVTAGVEGLLGLGFDHFTKCVVLPQGAFAKFLHDKSADRQDLLVKLLDLGVYERVAAAANQEGQGGIQRAAALSEVLDRPPLVGATPAALDDARGRVRRLVDLRAQVGAAQATLTSVRAEVATLDTRLGDITARASLLDAVVAPDGIGALSSAVAEATRVDAEAAAHATRLEAAASAAEGALRRLPPGAEVQASLDAMGELDQLGHRIEKGLALIAGVSATEAELRTEFETASSDVQTAASRREELVVSAAAHAVARHLVVGEPCPVCHQFVAVIPPSAPVTADLDDAERAISETNARQALVRDRLASLHGERSGHDARLAELVERRTELLVRLGDGRSADGSAATMAAIGAAEEAARTAQLEARAAREVATLAAARVRTLAADEREARSRFDTTRDRLASLCPPSPARRDLAADWAELVSWARATRRATADDLEHAAKRRRALIEESGRLAADMRAACEAGGVALPGTPPGGLGTMVGEAVAAAEAGAQRDVVEMEAAIAEARRMREEVGELRAHAELATGLARHLSARNFERWLLDEAVQLLVEGATSVLQELSSQAYSLTLDAAGSFAVIDHRNADAVRSAKTLSGGETFLTSLALALSLADRLSQLATDGAARLEAIFLDEGFGALDPDTLETVAVAIEGLAAGGRVVGLVTHLRDLADRVPIRFEVTRSAAGSTVERVEE